MKVKILILKDKSQCFFRIHKENFTSDYYCWQSLPLKHHLQKLWDNEQFQKMYAEMYPDLNTKVNRASFNISDANLSSNAFYRDNFRFPTTLKFLEISLPNMESFDINPFHNLISLKELKVSNLQVVNFDFERMFCDISETLDVLELTDNRLNCSCNLTDSVANMRRCLKPSIQIEINCLDNDGNVINEADYEDRNLCASGTTTVAAAATPVLKLNAKEHEDHPTFATLVLIIILSVVLISIILFAVILYVSNRYCQSKRNGSKYDSAKASNKQKEFVANTYVNSSPRHILAPEMHLYGPQNEVPSSPKKMSNTPPKQVKFRPLSREYQPIDGVPFDNQLPVLNSPERQANMPYSISEQHEPNGTDENQNWPQDGEFHV